jgi:hypothetical protein
MSVYLGDMSDTEWLSTECPGFLPHLVVGFTEQEWDLFCRICDALPTASGSRVIRTIEWADAVLNDPHGLVAKPVVVAFQQFTTCNHMSLIEGLIHPYSWVRNLAQMNLRAAECGDGRRKGKINNKLEEAI